ncbi:MAG TPA: hypothetical protein VK815_02920 [Candidatus Acidoferrales bacterium]|jgi:hypothetical protein|nr:hypothetical protein [Candidatus Acidoferrales bacterium]
MKHPIKHALIVLVGALTLAALAVFGIFVWATGANIDQSKGPTSREDALVHCSIPLPASARNIQYASYAAGLQEGHFYVRFEAPVADCYSNAKAIFIERAKHAPSYVIPEFQPVSHPERAKSSDLRIDWFDNDRISKGMVAGAGQGWEPKIWIDEERGVFYYEDND